MPVRKSISPIYVHEFIDLSDRLETTRIDLSKVETLQYDHKRTKAALHFERRDKPLEIYCTQESLTKLIEAWERVRGFVVRMV